MDDFLYVRELGADDGPSDYPSFHQTGALLLIAEEAILWQRSAYRPSCLRTRGASSERLWTLPTSTAVTITNRRLVLSCQKYNVDDDERGGWGMTPVGVALAGLARMARSFRWAKERRRTTKAGQLRFEWPSSVGLGGRRTSDWTRLFVRWHDAQAQMSLDLPLGTPVSRAVAVLLASCIAKYRLANRHLMQIGDDAWGLLSQQPIDPVENATADGSEYELPGYLPYPTILHSP